MTDLLILGGTAWLGREIAAAALARGDRVTCLARGESGAVPGGVELVRADRSDPDAYTALTGRAFDQVVEISWQPGWVRRALAALGPAAGHWTLVSSCSVYASHDTPGADESAPLAEPLAGDEATAADYDAAKSASEAATVDAVGDRAVLARVGLIGGPGDGSQRTSYWPGRARLAGSGDLLIPDRPDDAVQIIDVRDLAAFLLNAGAAGRVGPVNVVGESTPLPEALGAAIAAAATAPVLVPASAAWLADHDVAPWSGPRSLPLWLPAEGYSGFNRRSDARALAWGLTRRPLTDTFVDALPDELTMGPDAPRKSGLRRSDELPLIAELTGRA